MSSKTFRVTSDMLWKPIKRDTGAYHIDEYERNMLVDHPGDFSNKVGYDLYLNPWWAARLNIDGFGYDDFLIEAMTDTLGKPDLWFNGLFHELLWGPRGLDRTFRPGFHANLSGTNAKIWKHFWLPWRAANYKHATLCDSLFGGNVLHDSLSIGDIVGLELYAIKINESWSAADFGR